MMQIITKLLNLIPIESSVVVDFDLFVDISGSEKPYQCCYYKRDRNKPINESTDESALPPILGPTTKKEPLPPGGNDSSQVGDTGLESNGATGSSGNDLGNSDFPRDAQYDARDDDLAFLVYAWPSLPEATQAEILAIVNRATAKP